MDQFVPDDFLDLDEEHGNNNPLLTNIDIDQDCTTNNEDTQNPDIFSDNLDDLDAAPELHEPVDSIATDFGPTRIYQSGKNEEKEFSFPVYVVSHYSYRGKELSNLSRIEYYSIVSIKESSSQTIDSTGSTGRKKSNLFPIGKGSLLQPTHHQVLSSIQSIPNLGKPPKFPGAPPAEDQPERSKKVWQAKADTFAEFYLTAFRPEEKDYDDDHRNNYLQYNWDALCNYVSNMESRQSTEPICKLRLNLMFRSIHGMSTSEAKTLLSKYRGRNRDIWTDLERECARLHGSGNTQTKSTIFDTVLFNQQKALTKRWYESAAQDLHYIHKQQIALTKVMGDLAENSDTDVDTHNTLPSQSTTSISLLPEVYPLFIPPGGITSLTTKHKDLLEDTTSNTSIPIDDSDDESNTNVIQHQNINSPANNYNQNTYISMPEHFTLCDKADAFITSLTHLNKGQKAIANIILSYMKALGPCTPKRIFGPAPKPLHHLITGGPGTGKSTVVNEVLEKLNDIMKSVILIKVSAFGIAACNIGGNTTSAIFLGHWKNDDELHTDINDIAGPTKGRSRKGKPQMKPLQNMTKAPPMSDKKKKIYVTSCILATVILPVWLSLMKYLQQLLLYFKLLMNVYKKSTRTTRIMVE